MSALLPRFASKLPVRSMSRAPDHDAIRAYYVAAQEDYRRWSPGYNMHFGYWAWGLNPFNREAMLERMNEEALAGLALPEDKPSRVVDIGCGAGATSRAIARKYRRAEVTGVTLVHEQIMLGCRLNRQAGLARRIGYLLSDFSETWLGAGSQDAAIAIESLCYAAGPGKAAAIREAARMLAPGGRLVVVDGFLVKGSPTGLLGWIYRRWCDSWAIGELAQLAEFKRELAAAGFVDIEVRDLSARIAPSAAHIPWVATSHMVRELWIGRGRLSPWRWRHIAASWLSIPLGLALGSFRYCKVTARKESP
jgi:cyclopropane fatty-acyl-phospholipid synthase-like methyltransferase